jgi:hypothetical protein
MEQYDVEFETINEVLYNNYSKGELESIDIIFKNTIGQEILDLIKSKKQDPYFESKIIANKNINDFYQRVFNSSCPKILKFNINIQQLYILHIFILSFIRFNNSDLHFDENAFINDFLLPNIYYLCTKQLILAKKVLYKIIKNCYHKIEVESKTIIDFYSMLYKCDSEVIKNQILNIFFCNTISKINPLDMVNIEDIYENIIYRLFFYYIKMKTSKVIDSNYINSISKDQNIEGQSDRYYIYEKAIYLSHIENMCTSNDVSIQVSSHYDKIKNIVIPNELQKLYLLYQMKNISINNKVALLRTCDNLDKIEKFKNYIPLIYRVLRSIHVDDKTITSSYDTHLIYTTIFNTLHLKFKNMISDDALLPFVEKVSNNLVKSLTVGKFIDMLTLTEVNTAGVKFCEQLQKFLDLILTNIEGP